MGGDDDRLDKLRVAVRERPLNVVLRLSLALALLEADDPQSAWHHCIRVLRVVPDHVEALHLAAEAASGAGWPHRATQYLERLAAVEPASPEAKPERKSRPREKEVEVKGRSLRVIRGGLDESGIYRY